MARIYIGRATGIGAFERHVVLKMILPERANDETSVQMFLDEARLAASLNHQNVAQVFEVGQDAGIHYLAMEYVHGQDLRALLAKAGSSGTRVPLELALTVVAGAASGLHHAHERRNSDGSPMGIVHRDVSPSNIMIGYDGAVKLLDFGIAKATSRSVETQSGIIKGKFAYMAPEQCRGRDVDRRSDVFSIGIILYEVTTQHRCFRADSDFDTMHRIVTGDIVRPTRLVQGYPQALEAIVMKALSVDPAARYQSAGELLEAVEGFAVGSRMSLSTMSLGRFMRDMFGDIAEPWLEPGRLSQPMMAREQTISNTNASGDREAPMRHEDAPLHLPPTSILEVPQPGELADHEAWSAKGYPSMPPAYASPATLPPDPAMGHSQPHATAHPAPGASGHMPADRSQPFARPSQSNVSHVSHISVSSPQLRAPALPRPSGIANGSQPIPPQWAPQPGSGSGSAHNALPIGGQLIPRTRQGYANAPGIAPSEISYPRYEPPPGEATPSLSSNSNRLVYAGLAVLLIGIIVILAISIADSSDDLPPPPRRAAPAETQPAPQAAPPQQTASNGATLTPEPVKPEAFHAAAAADAGAAAVHDESIVVHVVSTPPGADVLLSGKPIGTTPLETKIQRGTGSANLTVHRAKFADVTTAIDLTTDFHKEVTLTPIEDKPAQQAKPQVKAAPTPVRETPKPRDDKPRETPKREAAKTAQKCQSPSQYNPFDRGCNGAACPPCS